MKKQLIFLCAFLLVPFTSKADFYNPTRVKTEKKVVKKSKQSECKCMLCFLRGHSKCQCTKKGQCAKAATKKSTKKAKVTKAKKSEKVSKRGCARCTKCDCVVCTCPKKGAKTSKNQACDKKKQCRFIPVSIGMIGMPADKKKASFSSVNKFSKDEIVIVQHKYEDNYVYGRVAKVGKSDRNYTVYLVKPNTANPFESLVMKPSRIGKIKR